MLQARTPANLEEVAFRPARERLTFSHGPGGLSVTNGLDASIVLLLYREGDTMYRLDGPLSSGSQQTLSQADAAQALPAGVSIPPKFLPLVEHQPPGSYLALLDRSPFWDPGASGVIESGSVHLVLGWPEGQR